MSLATCLILENAALLPGFMACTLPLDAGRPRSVLAVGAADLLVLERDSQSVVRYFDSDGDGLPESKQSVANAPSLNHGIALNDGYIYASSDTTVYRWSYSSEDFSSVGEQQIVVENINADGQGGAPQGHTTRTLAFDDVGRLYISVGSGSNVDRDSFRSRIRRFELAEGILPLDFQTGEVFADGLRNEVGLAFDKYGVLWGVENGADNLFRSDLGGDIHNDNPAEELNRFREQDAGKHWGYPYCWAEFQMIEPPGLGRGTVWAWPFFLANGEITDDQCRADYVPPIVSMQAHSAPLGIAFYDWKPQSELPPECDGTAFPEKVDGFAFIAFHGSWNRDPPTGYKVVYVPMDSIGDVAGEPVDLLAHNPPNANWEDGFRPVDVAFDGCGRLIVTSDGTGGRGDKLVRLGSNPPTPEPSTSPTVSFHTQSESPTTTSRPTLSSRSNHPSSMPSDSPSFTFSNKKSPTTNPMPTVNPSSSPAESSSREVTFSRYLLLEVMTVGPLWLFL